MQSKEYYSKMRIVSSFLHFIRTASKRFERRAFAFIARLLRKFWVVQLFLGGISVLFFFALWSLSDNTGTLSTTVIGAAQALLPVLAMTGAITLLGASAQISRNSGADIVSGVAAKFTKYVDENYDRLLNGKGRWARFYRQSELNRTFLKLSLTELTFSDRDELLYVHRPYWDGAWFFGVGTFKNREDNAMRCIQLLHEETVCAWTILRIVVSLRDRGASYLKSIGGGAQGSVWFIESLENSIFFADLQNGKMPKSLSSNHAARLINLAHKSLFYMNEELRDQQEDLSWEEFRRFRFLQDYVDFAIWINHLHLKSMHRRGAKAARRLMLSQKSLANLSIAAQSLRQANFALFELRREVYGHSAKAEKALQIRVGSIVPLLFMGTALLIHTIMYPLVATSSMVALHKSIAYLAYSFGAAGIGINILFALWLLIPWRLPTMANLHR